MWGGALQPVVELLPMSQVNAALQKVRENQARYHIILVNAPPGGAPNPGPV